MYTKELLVFGMVVFIQTSLESTWHVLIKTALEEAVTCLYMLSKPIKLESILAISWDNPSHLGQTITLVMKVGWQKELLDLTGQYFS